jgi:hydroxyethylthiazole kinase-like uncharacterized protein yjeF
MKIISARQMRDADAFTVANKPISSLELMEIAANECFEWILNHRNHSKKFIVICGTGNNGGDGLVIARKLYGVKISVEVIVLDSGNHSSDFDSNLVALKKFPVPVQLLKEGDSFPNTDAAIIIDAIFGTGLSRPVEGWIGECIDAINGSGNEIISIDLPSGLNADNHSEGKIICAKDTLTFQSPKLAFFFSENEKYTGNFHVLEIGLDKNFIEGMDAKNAWISLADVKHILKPRGKFSHKGLYGHSLLVSGSYGKMGAAVISARACLRSGTGLLTVHIPKCGYEILQIALPEAMTSTDTNEGIISNVEDIDKYDAIGIGPGIGTSEIAVQMFSALLEKADKSIVADADALNILALNKNLLDKLPSYSILTPHPKEFERLVGKYNNEFERHRMQIEFSVKHKVVVVLKGSYTCISTPEAKAFFNSTGNPGMSKGGSGDALTGIILALLAQHCSPVDAALLGVYIHGLAGDFAMRKKGTVSMIASDLIEKLPAAFNYLKEEN